MSKGKGGKSKSSSKTKESTTDKVSDLERGKLRAKNARAFIDTLTDDFIKKANDGKLSKQQFQRAAQALRSIVTDSHITGIAPSSIRLGVEALDSANLIIKVSIGTPKTRKTFSIRKRL